MQIIETLDFLSLPMILGIYFSLDLFISVRCQNWLMTSVQIFFTILLASDITKAMRVKGVIMSLALHYCVRGAHHCSGSPISEMTYIVSSGTLNSTIPYLYETKQAVR